MDGQELGGRWLKIMMSFEKPAGSARSGEAKPKPEGCTTVFIGNLSWSIDEVRCTAVRRTLGIVDRAAKQLAHSVGASIMKAGLIGLLIFAECACLLAFFFFFYQTCMIGVVTEQHFWRCRL